METPAADTVKSESERKPAHAAPTTNANLPGMPDLPNPAAFANPKADIEALENLERHLFAHRYARTGIESYGATIDPAAATQDRGEVLAILAEEDQQLLCSAETGALLARLQTPHEQAILSPTQRDQVHILVRDRTSMVDVPPEVNTNFMRLTNRSYEAWLKAKAANDWESFAPFLDQIVEALRELAGYKNPTADPYEVWLQENEHDSSVAFYDRFFDEVRESVVPLLRDVRRSRRGPGRSFFEGRFDAHRQWELSRDLMLLEGLDPNEVFLTSTEHPFSEALTSNYGIIATHIRQDDLLATVFSLLHEGGHTLYELGVNPELNYTSLKGGTSIGMHESQSRFFENYVGRSRAFAPQLLDVMRRHFRGQLGRITPGQLYTSVNRVTPQPIRTEADELTYPLHVLIRYEIEKLLMSGEATAADVPALWAERYHSYLGLTIDGGSSIGALQDVHWSQGALGYFPTYALGSAIGAQLRNRMMVEGMDLDSLMSTGNLDPIREWLRLRIWYYGRSRDTSEILLNATGEPLSPVYYTDYLNEKFSQLYGL